MHRNKNSFSVESLISHVDGNEKLEDHFHSMPLVLEQDNNEAIQPTFVENDINATTSMKDNATSFPGDIKAKKEIDEPTNSLQGIHCSLLIN